MLEKVKVVLKKLWVLSGSLPYLRFVLLGAVLVACVILFYRCGSAPSQNEIDLKNKTGEVIEQKAESNVATQGVEQAEKSVDAQRKVVRSTREVANKAVNAAEEKREKKQGDVTYEQANRARCEAYPEDSECKRGN